MSTVEILANQEYKYGFVTDIESDMIPRGLSEDTIRLIVAKKNEPEWMLESRLKAYRHWLKITEPRHWTNLTFPPIDYQDIIYYSAPKQKATKKSLDEVDPELLRTFEKLGIPITEQKQLANVAVDAVFDSVSVATTYKEKLRKHGVIFCSFTEAIREHPELVRKYLGSVVPTNDNFFAALNSAVFSDGSFCFIPKGVRCPMELSTYFRINNSESGQFERTLIVAEEGAYVSILKVAPPPSSIAINCTRPWSSWWRWTTPKSSTRQFRIGTRAMKKGRVAFITLSPSAANARAAIQRFPGRRWKPDQRSPGSIRHASCRATTRSASSIQSL